MIKKIAFVAHPSRDLAAAKKFWCDQLGLSLTGEYGDKWAEVDTPEGKTIALDNASPDGGGPYLALETDGIEDEVARLREAGVTIVKDVWDNKVCKMALIQDPQGSVLMLHQIAPDRAKPSGD